MRLLSVANIASPVGGTGRCAIDCVNALPHWDHANLFINGNSASSRSMRAALGWAGTQIWIGRRRVAEVVREWEPDLVLYHNTGDDEMPGKLHRNIPTAYYYHSAHSRRPSTHQMIVSKALANRLQWGHDKILYQPVACPDDTITEGEKSVKISRASEFTIGRLCTPHRSKWPAGVIAFYRRLANDHPMAHWEFVGCPPGLESELRHACSGRVTFRRANPDARAWLHRWHVMLYDGGWESYGRVACESQQAGCVPVVSRGGGFVEQIKNAETGYLCQTVSEFSKAIEALRFDLHWSKVSRAAKQFGAKRGSLERWGKAFAKLVGVPYDPMAKAA